VPNALLHNLKHNKVLHEHNLFVTVRNHEVPWIGLDKRLAIESLGHNCWQVVVHYGFKNDPDLPARAGADPRAAAASWSHDHQLLPVARRGGAHHRRRHGAWREKLFARCTTTPAARRTS
jgi:KUP system potassium uptake protein